MLRYRREVEDTSGQVMKRLDAVDCLGSLHLLEGIDEVFFVLILVFIVMVAPYVCVDTVSWKQNNIHQSFTKQH